MTFAKFEKRMIKLFNKEVLCRVEIVGEPKENYSRYEVLWVERGEDEYARDKFGEQYCVLYREDWLAASGE